MEVVYPRCAGLDLDKKKVVVSAITPEGQETRSFSAVTRELLALAEWLAERQITHVAMESTGSYWKPVYNILEGQFELLVVNAQHLKRVPGRKTDVKDAEWIADLLRHGLLRASFIPDRPQRELRELVRHRRRTIQDRSRVVNRVQQVLEGANIKLAAVATDVMGKSGRAMLEAMVAGTQDPKLLAALARGRLKAKRPALEAALEGQVGPHQRFMLASLLRQVDFLDSEVLRLDQEVEERMYPCEEVLQRLDTIPGIGQRAGQEILAEVGVDVTRWPTAGHFASWIKICPGNNQSGGRARSAPIGHGNQALQGILIEAARAAARTHNTYLSAQYRRLAARRGPNRAAVAVAHSLSDAIYYMLLRGTTYQELGPSFFDERNREGTIRRLTHRLEALGCEVVRKVA